MVSIKKQVESLQQKVFDPQLEGNSGAITAGIKECIILMKEIESALEHETSQHQKMHLTGYLARVKSFREMFNAMRITGEGYSPRKQTASDRVKWEDMQSAFASRVRTAVITNNKHLDPKKFLEDCSSVFGHHIKRDLTQQGSLKVNIMLSGLFEKSTADKLIEEIKHFNSRNAVIYGNTDLLEWFKVNVEKPLLTDLDDFQEAQSGWALKSILNLQVNINKYTPLLVGSSYIELPMQIKRKEACINIKNTDEACFAWAVVSALYPANTHSDRPSSYPHFNSVLNLTGIQFPITMRQIPLFEKQNNLTVNVYKLDGGKSFEVTPLYITNDKKDRHINLLMIQYKYYSEDEVIESDLAPIKFHYVWIKNMSRLLSKKLSKHEHAKYLCDRCLHYFYSGEKLSRHAEDCKKLNDCILPKVPTEDKKIIEFKNFKNKEKAPFIIYADAECLLEPLDEDVNSKKNTKKYQKHVPYSVGYYVKCAYDDSLSYYRAYTGKDCIKWFVRELLQFAEDVEPVFLCPHDMTPLTSQQKHEFAHATHCHICNKPFTAGDIKVRDHNHLVHPDNNNYRGPAHESCNINYQDSHTVPVVFHNMSAYDSHLIIRALAEADGTIELLPVNKERYISFTKRIKDSSINFRFIDSFRFLASSLDKLASYLPSYPTLRSEFKDLPEDQFKLLCRKGVFPYDFMDSWEKLQYHRLPKKENFFNKLEGTYINNKQYKHAEQVWKQFGCKNMLDYSNVYLTTDIILLCEIFEQFRESCMKTYSLDPGHYYTLPGYTWDCMLYKTDQQLELLTDIEMILFIEKGIRGGLSQCSKRFSAANNKYMPTYDSSKESTYNIYYDLNNQYGWCMGQNLPYGGFKWLEEDEIATLDVRNLGNDDNVGYIVEVDLKIPRGLHDKFADLPPCPEHYDPTKSPDEQNTAKTKKLMATLLDKKKYVMHYRNLKQALELGVKLEKMHRVLQFKQAAWLKPYIDLNTMLRQNAKNEFEKNLFKLMNNAVFGKTMENIRKHTTIKLKTNWDGRYGVEALIANPQFKSISIFSENLVAIEMAKTKVYFNKPIYVGMCILDLAKTTIYDFHYNYMKNRFPGACVLLYTDTDSLVYEIRHPDVYEVMKQDCNQYFDTSDYTCNNIYGIPQVNKKVLGMMKDENNGTIMTHFVGLRSKMYAIKVLKTDDEKCKYQKELEEKETERGEMMMLLNNFGITKKIKGIKKSVMKTSITFNDYLECLDYSLEKSVSQNLIRSYKHQLFSETTTKIALSPHDDKRFIVKGSVNTLPLGHYTIITKREHSDEVPSTSKRQKL